MLCRPSSVRLHWSLLLTTQRAFTGAIVALLERRPREPAFDLLKAPAALQAIWVLLEDLEHRLQDLSCPLAGDLSQSSSPPGPAPYKGDDPRTTRGLPSIDNSCPGVPR